MAKKRKKIMWWHKDYKRRKKRKKVYKKDEARYRGCPKSFMSLELFLKNNNLSSVFVLSG